MTVADVNALLYLAGRHDVEQLRRALRIPALSPGWQASLRALLDEQLGGSAGRRERRADGARSTAGVARLPHAAGRGEAVGEQRRRVPRAGVRRRSARSPGRDPASSSRSSSGRARAPRHSCAATRSRDHRAMPATGSASRSNPTAPPATTSARDVGVGDRLEVGAPRGSFILDDSERPVVLVSAGVGVTPLLAMLHALHDRRSTRDIWWFHGARNRSEHAFADETRSLLDDLAHVHRRIWYSRPSPTDRVGHGLRRGRSHHPGGTRSGGRPDRRRVLPVRTDRVHGRVARRVSPRSGFPPDACTRRSSVPRSRSRPESSPLRRGRRINPRAHRDPDRSSRSCGPASTCVGVKGGASILELAEACDVPVRWSCRSGVCHTCETGLLDGTVDYAPEPLEAPADGNLLVCCSRPDTDLVIDL